MDLVAVKRNNRQPDRLEIMLVQVKGGSGRISEEEIKRLRKARRRLKITLGAAEMPRTKVHLSRVQP